MRGGRCWECCSLGKSNFLPYHGNILSGARDDLPCFGKIAALSLRADHILIEFKHTESVGLSAFRQAAGYDYFYKSFKKLTNRQVQTFLVSSKTVKQETLDKFSYFPTDKGGVLMLCKPDSGEKGGFQHAERSKHRSAFRFRQTEPASARLAKTLVFKRRRVYGTDGAGTDARNRH